MKWTDLNKVLNEFMNEMFNDPDTSNFRLFFEDIKGLILN